MKTILFICTGTICCGAMMTVGILVCGPPTPSATHLVMTTQALSPALTHWSQSFDPRARIREARWVVASAIVTGGLLTYGDHQQNAIPKGEISVVFSGDRNPIIELQKSIAASSAVNLRGVEAVRFEFLESAVGSRVILRISHLHKKSKAFLLGVIPADRMASISIRDLGLSDAELATAHLRFVTPPGAPVMTKSAVALYPFDSIAPLAIRSSS